MEDASTNDTAACNAVLRSISNNFPRFHCESSSREGRCRVRLKRNVWTEATRMFNCSKYSMIFDTPCIERVLPRTCDIKDSSETTKDYATSTLRRYERIAGKTIRNFLSEEQRRGFGTESTRLSTINYSLVICRHRRCR